MTDKMFRYLNHTSVEGLDLIFKVLCLICKIMIYRLPIRDSIDMIYDDDLKEYLTINEVLCVLNDLHKDNLELKDTMKRMAIEMMGG